jgi:putative Mn2+ efflux pump MntP
LLTLLLVAGSVGLDNFAAAIAIGLTGVDRRVRLRIAVVFGVFEAGMPVIGLLVGRGLSGSLGAQAHLVGGGLLIAAGAQTAVVELRSGDGNGDGDGHGHGHGHDRAPALAGAPLGRLIVLAAGLSIDNLIIGFALGAHRAPLVLSIVVIGVVSVGLSLLGLELGQRLGERIERWSELLGAAVLIAVGVAILFKVI